MPPSDRPPGAFEASANVIADTIELLFNWLGGPDKSEVSEPAKEAPPEPSDADIVTEGEEVP